MGSMSMINILIYNEVVDQMEFFMRDLNDPMPYITGGTLTVGEFRAKSNSNIIWTTVGTMEAWNATRAAWGNPIYVGYAFRRIGEGGHSNQSQHYAGTAFDAAQNLEPADRDRLRNLADSLGVWTYVEPTNLTPTWIHFDARYGTPACSAGYPMLSEGSRGVYVATLQDALGTAGIPSVGIDGLFGANTRWAVMQFQAENNLSADGIVGCSTWQSLTAQTNGFYKNNNTVPPEYSNE